MQKETQTTRNNAAIERFVLMVYLLDFQYPVFFKEVKGKFKQRVTAFSNHLKWIRNDYAKNELVHKELDDLSAIAWEVLDELVKAPNKLELLALMKAYNAGEVQGVSETKAAA